jgi:hypothetical protein
MGRFFQANKLAKISTEKNTRETAPLQWVRAERAEGVCWATNGEVIKA